MRQPFFQSFLQSRLWKFCVVGASSTVIDKGIFWLLMSAFPTLPWWVSQSIAFVFGVTNGFFWNRFWTFASESHGSMRRQYPKFVATNLIGLLLNLLITKGFLLLFIGTVTASPTLHRMHILLASLCSIPLVVVWNFTASHFWTFKTPNSSQPSVVLEEAPPIASPHTASKPR